MSSHHTKRPVARIRWRKNQALVEPVTPTLLELHERLEAVERELAQARTSDRQPFKASHGESAANKRLKDSRAAADAGAVKRWANL